MALGCFQEQLITGTGEFRAKSRNFSKAVKFHNPGRSYRVVSIMGAHGSGKSTLMNNLFNTSFREMDASRGRSRTTQGIWIANAPDIHPFTIVMDLEGTDSRERGEDGILFGKQSALFALAVSDVVLINLWCHDIGREQAADRPLLKTVFQVLLHTFDPIKKTLLFVLRDKTKTTFEDLKKNLIEDIHKIWEAIQKPQKHSGAHLTAFFNVEVIALPNYEEDEAQFQEQVIQVRKKYFSSSFPIWPAGDRTVVPVSKFLPSAEIIWNTIKRNKDLDLPALKVMVATVRCEQSVEINFDKFKSDKVYLDLLQEVQTGSVTGFGKTANSLMKKYLSCYDAECEYFEEDKRDSYRQGLQLKLLQLVQNAHTTLVRHLYDNGIHNFQTELEKSLMGRKFAESVRKWRKYCIRSFDLDCSGASVEQAYWDVSEVREELLRAIDKHALSVRERELSKLVGVYKLELHQFLTMNLRNYFINGEPDTWAFIRRRLQEETGIIKTKFCGDVTGFELDQAKMDHIMGKLEEDAWEFVEKMTRNEVGRVLPTMIDRFKKSFNFNPDSTPRVMNSNVDITAITIDARNESLKVLAMLAVIRRDERANNVEVLLFTLNGANRGSGVSGDPLASNEWAEVPREWTLITPVQCKNCWITFVEATRCTVDRAVSTQKVAAAEAATASPWRLYRSWISVFCSWIPLKYRLALVGLLLIAIVFYIR